MKYKLVKVSELEDLLQTQRSLKRDERDEAYESGYEDGKAEYEAEVEELQETVEEQKASLKKKNREITNLNTELEVFKKERADAKAVITSRLNNENVKADLDAREELVKKREEKVSAREEEIATKEASEEDKQYKAGYADGVSDGVRKIGEITAADRKDAMDVAKISAASHTQSETVKAVLDANTATSLKDKKTK